MTVTELLDTLRHRDIRVWVEGDRVRFNGPRGAITPDLQNELTQNRSQILEYLRAANNGPTRLTLGPVPPGEQTTLSFFQERLWILNRLDRQNVAYNLVASLRLTAALDEAALNASITEVVRRHEVLRSAFRESAGAPALVVTPPRPLHVPCIDLRSLSEEQQQARLAQLVAGEASRPFNLDQGDLLRASCARVGSDELVLLVAAHHIVTDGWSMGIFLYEWQTLYRAHLAGQPASLPDVPVQYTDYAYWERRWLRESLLDPQLAFWKTQLEGAPHVLSLPTDRPRPPMQTYTGAVQGFVLPADVADQLRAAAKDEGVTLFMALLATFNVLLRRYTGQDDLVVGTPIAVRNRPELEGTIGPFVNSLVLRNRLAPDDTSRSLRSRVRRTLLEAQAHQDVPFGRLVELINPERSLAYSPLFQVAYSFQNAPGRSAFSMMTGGSMYDLTVHSWEVDGTIGASFEYATALFDPGTIARMIRHFQTLLREMVAHPDRPLAELSMLTSEERSQLLVEWNDTARDYPRERIFSQLFEERVAAHPERIAVSSADASSTYLELNRRANQLAHHLRQRGIGPGARVAVCLERSPRMLEALLGVMKAGATYIPLDPAFPARRIAFMLQDAGAALVISEDAVLARLAREDRPVLSLDRDRAALDGEPIDNVTVTAGPADPAYVIYTSGSTGEPKGVEVSHGSLVNLLVSMREQPGLTEADVFYAITTVAFDISGLELFLPLLVGAKLVIASSAITQDGRRLQEDLAHWGATVMQATPATWQMLVDTGWGANGARTTLSAWSGGDALSRELAETLLTRAKTVWNLYGPTETTIWSTASRVVTDPGPVPIGRPIANTAIYLLDADRQPVPVGVVGEIYLGGAGVARGYLNRATLTAERFLSDPFSTAPGARMYRTGDLGRYRPDGELEHLGRVDHQVKLRGFRIELGEIEAVLTEHPAVVSAVAAVRNSRLVAYVVTQPEAVITATDARRFLRERLPDYMIPMLVVSLDRLPLTANGKLDRRGLPDPFADAGEANEIVPPTTPAEQLVAKVWQDLLGVNRISVHHSFFELGGHSLLAVKAAYEIEQLTGQPMDVRPLFFETLKQLAARCAVSPAANATPDPVGG